MALPRDSDREQVVPEEEDTADVRSVQARYLRSPSPSRFSVMSDTDTESIFMEPIHLSSAVAAKQIINEELKHKEVKVEAMPEQMMESAEQLLVEDLYNRVKDMMDDNSKFNTPCVLDIQRELTQDKLEAPKNPVDEVWPNVFIAEKSVAVNKARLKRLGITHILNAAHGTGVYTGPDFYTGLDIQYQGIEVDDFPDVDISKHFRPAAEFLDETLLTCRGKILVDSMMGVSRSAVLVAAYLMIFHHMTIMEALMTIRKKRPINPNEGFLKQLRELNETLLEERTADDDSDTLSQSSVIEAKTHSIMAEEEDSGSVMGAKVHSIMVEEEDDMSTMSSVMSSIAKASVASKRPTLIDEDEEDELYAEWRKKQGLPPSEPQRHDNESKLSKLPEQEEEEDVEQMIREWQSRNERYQSEDWWQSQLMSEDEQSLLGGKAFSISDRGDLESVNSLDIRTLKERLTASGIGRVRSDSISTEDSSADLWTQRLREIEDQAAARYARDGQKGKDSSENVRKEKDIDEESLFSQTSSLYNFCKKNKDKLTPLERWKIKRIEFGWNKKDAESAGGKKTDGSGEQAEGEENTPVGEVNLSAYQNWKLKHQKKLGTENKDEIVELGKGEDTASVKRKQRREEILERSRKTLEESQSMCGWETESSLSGSIPLSALWPNMSAKSVNDDTASMLSMQSNRSSVSRSTQGLPQAPMIPLPNIQVGSDDTISLASIQNWIANVVTETIVQKQNELLMQGSMPPSRSPSVMSMGSRTGTVGKNIDDDKASLLSMQSGVSYASSLLRQKDMQSTDTQSVISCGSWSEGFGSKQKITRTSKPLYSLFADDIDLKKLDTKEKEMKSEMRGKMFEYKKEKIAADNKRSTLFKKKKAKDDSEDEDDLTGTSGRYSYKNPDKADTASSISGRYSSLGTDGSDRINSIDKWLSDVKATSSKSSNSTTNESSDSKFTRSSYLKEDTAGSSDYKFSRRRMDPSEKSQSPYSSHEEGYRSNSRFSASAHMTDTKTYSSRRFTSDDPDIYGKTSPEPYVYRQSASETEPSCNGMSETLNRRTRPLHCSDEVLEDQDHSEFGPKRKFTQSFSRSKENEEEVKRSSSDEEDLSVTRRSRLRRRPKEEEELEGDNNDDDDDDDDDAIIAAWKSRQESRSRVQGRKEV
ncbi:serine/threonine/tyrosine-interacting-like protein 2 [Acipenser ruthenus]|uniref:serine/threonine/tyrosine-interacting-like protein 2 n=1 Tax=Acipenser ruthenus TaxID=7906 RepID=UPI0027403819|nr:serine/threonine/tyrosine-interacting-like protein 2 [Acipenser ruthenus]XP_058885218.1 serine/threonine/tyrosine-interacting-like protein 2 [Acipenser ruthenus]